MCTICSKEKIKFDLDLRGSPVRTLLVTRLGNFKPRLLFPKVSASHFVAEEELDIRHRLEFIKEPLVETTPIDSTNKATVHIVCLRRLRQSASRRATMDHAAVHGDGLSKDGIQEPRASRVAESIYAPL